MPITIHYPLRFSTTKSSYFQLQNGSLLRTRTYELSSEKSCLILLASYAPIPKTHTKPPSQILPLRKNCRFGPLNVLRLVLIFVTNTTQRINLADKSIPIDPSVIVELFHRLTTVDTGKNLVAADVSRRINPLMSLPVTMELFFALQWWRYGMMALADNFT